MKKIATLALSAVLMTGLAFAHDGDKKKCTKDCCNGKECKKDDKKETAKTTKTATAVKTVKKA